MIKVFKMINGEEIISKVTEAGFGYDCEDPANIVIQQTEKGIGVNLAPFMPYASGKVTIRYSAIAAEADADPKMEQEYNRVFGAGIEIVSASALAGLKIVP